MHARLAVCCFLISLISSMSKAQIISNMGDGLDPAMEQNFLFEVKSPDEFIERFNDDTSSLLRKEYQKANRPFKVKRKMLVFSLFADRTKAIDSNGIRFINQVTDSVKPQYLWFYDSTWYAEVNVTFSYEGKRINVPLVLQVTVDSNKVDHWKIAGIDNVPLTSSASKQDGSKKRQGKTPTLSPLLKDTASLHPMSSLFKKDTSSLQSISGADHTANFMVLFRVLVPGLNEKNVFMPGLLASDKGKRFIALIRAGKLKYLQVVQVKYHFFQIPNYVFVVERFSNATNHSGWLISSNERLPLTKKKLRKQQLLKL